MDAAAPVVGQALHQFPVAHGGGMARRQDHEVHSTPVPPRGREHVLVRPEAFPHQALDPVAPDRVFTDTGGNGESEAGVVEVVGACQHAKVPVI